MALKAWTNISGTTAPGFTIGKDGATIHNGTTAPASNLGNLGDLYVRSGPSAGLFQKEAGGWKSTNSNFVRQEIARGSSALVSDAATYVAIISGPAGTTTLTLGAGSLGREVTIKDEIGTGSIVILGDIDGLAQYDISAPRGSVTLLWADHWMVVRQS